MTKPSYTQPNQHHTQAGTMVTYIHCTATNRKGNPCQGRPITGGHVCRMHGGAIPQVKQSAKERLLAGADKAAGELLKLLGSRDETVRLRAATALLDRAGHGPSSTLTNLNVDAGKVNYTIRGVDMDAV